MIGAAASAQAGLRQTRLQVAGPATLFDPAKAMQKQPSGEGASEGTSEGTSVRESSVSTSVMVGSSSSTPTPAAASENAVSNSPESTAALTTAFVAVASAAVSVSVSKSTSTETKDSAPSVVARRRASSSLVSSTTSPSCLRRRVRRSISAHVAECVFDDATSSTAATANLYTLASSVSKVVQSSPERERYTRTETCASVGACVTTVIEGGADGAGAGAGTTIGADGAVVGADTKNEGGVDGAVVGAGTTNEDSADGSGDGIGVGIIVGCMVSSAETTTARERMIIERRQALISPSLPFLLGRKL